jgi:hypothetical protein
MRAPFTKFTFVDAYQDGALSRSPVTPFVTRFYRFCPGLRYLPR